MAIRLLKPPVILLGSFRLEHGHHAPSNELRPTRLLVGCQLVQSLNQVVIELHQNLTSSHVHMVFHMVAACPSVPDVSDPFDTTIHEPPFHSGDEAHLLFSVERSRATFAWKVGGLATQQLHRRSVPTTTMTLGGLLKHLALCEDRFTAEFLRGEPLPEPWRSVDGSVWSWCWTSSLRDSADHLYGLWGAAVTRARTAWTTAIGTGGLDQPSAVVLHDGSRPTLRRALIDLSDEYARHVGHADLLREAIDGLVGEDPPQH